MAFDRLIVEAQLALNRVSSTDLPRIAWDAIEAGLDGPAIRRLAALEAPSYFQLREVLPPAMNEMHLENIDKGEAALRLARARANYILASNLDPLRHLRDFELLWWDSDYCRQLRDVGNLDDEVHVARYGGQSDVEIREWVMARLKNLAP